MINDVYRVVQVILNKNNYGTIDPDRFNSLAKDAQLKIYYDLPADMQRIKRKRNNTGVAEALKPLQNALDVFNDRQTILREVEPTSPSGFSEHFVLPDDFYYEDSIWFRGDIKVEKISKELGRHVIANPLTAPTTLYPLYERRGSRVFIFPTTIGLTTTGGVSTINSEVFMYYQRRPIDPKWTFVSVNNKPVFNPSDSSFQDFEMPEYFFRRLIVEIAFLSGIHLREKEVEQFMNQEQSDDFQKQNVN